TPVFGDKALHEGRVIARGSYIDASYRELDRQNACRYRLCSEIVVFPIDLAGAEYFSSPAPLEALGLRANSETLAGMRLTFNLRTTANAEDEPSDKDALKKPEMLLSSCRVANLPLYFVGAESDSISLLEQLFAHCKGVYFRYLDEFGDPIVVAAPPDCLEQVGFESEDALFPNDWRVFEGFDLLREYFTFSRKFLGCRLTGLKKIFSQLKSKTVDV